MNEKLLRLGTTYIPVTDVELSFGMVRNQIGGRVKLQR